MKKLTKILVLVFILLATAVSGTKVETFGGTEGFSIDYPHIDVIPVSQDMSFHFHVFNMTHGIPVFNTSVECHFHLYNNSGNHIFKDENIQTITDTFDFEVTIDGENFSTAGSYSYIFQCNTTNYGGYVAVPLEVTNDGLPEGTDSSGGIAIVLVMLSVVFVLLVIPFKIVFNKNPIVNDLMCRGCWAVGIFVLSNTIVMAATIASNANIGVLTGLLNMMWIANWAGYVLIMVMAIDFVFKMVYHYKDIEKNKRMGGGEE